MAPSEKLGKIPEDFPTNYTYKLRDDKILVKEVTDETSAKKWLEDYEQSSNSHWTISRTYVTSGHKVAFKEQWKCQFNVQSRSNGPKKRKVTSKNLNCTARITATVYRPIKKSKSKLKLDASYPCHLEVLLQHNHLFDSAAIVRYNPMLDETREKLKELFMMGHTASSAREQLKLNIYIKEIENYVRKSADNAFVPTVAQIQHLFNKSFQNTYGARSGEEVDKDLNNLLLKYCEETTDGKAVFGTVGEHKYVAICTPIMTRAHKLLPQSAELVLVDCSGNMDSMNHRVYIFCAPGPPGGIPLGCIITDVEKKEVFQAALEKFMTIVPDPSFFGKNYPTVTMTDDDLKERGPLHIVWEETVLLLCQFHLLKAHWGWLYESKHKIHKDDRQRMYFGFKKLVHARTEEELQSAFKAHIAEFQEKYAAYTKYVTDRYARCKEWADAFRSHLPIRGNNTTNYIETIFRILKDCVFERVKALNLTQLVDFLLVKYEGYMERRLLDFAHDRYCKSMTKKYLPREENRIDPSVIIRMSSDSSCFSVPSKSRPGLTHLVDAQHGFCSCENGRSGKICSHLNAVLLHFCLQNQMFIVSLEMKGVVFEIATGTKASPTWLLPLNTHPDDVQAILEGKIVQEKEGYTHMDVEEQHAEDNSGVHLSADDGPSSPETMSEAERDGLKSLFKRIEEGIEKNPDTFCPAVKKLLKNVDQFVKTDSALVSALHTFGRYTGLAAVSSVGSRHGPKIGVQPTSVARRKYSLGGKRRIAAGRRPGGSKMPAEVRQHDYTNFGLLPMNKIRAQHNLQQCVEKNISLPNKRTSAA